MGKLTTKQRVFMFEARGKLGMAQLSTAELGVNNLGIMQLGRQTYIEDPVLPPGVYQNKITRKGKETVHMKYYVTPNPRTEAQQAQREKFKAAMVAWKSLTEEEQQVYNKQAKRMGLFGRNLYIKRNINNF